MIGRVHRSSLWRSALAGLAVLLLVAGHGAAETPDDDGGPLLAFVQTAVAKGRVEQSRVLGFNNPNKQFHEMPEDGGVLVGFDLGLGKFFDIETVYALRAVYQTRHGDLRLQEHGLFRDKRLANGKGAKTKVLRTVHVQARPGYAVSGVTIRSGLNINGLSVTFMKIDGQALDPLRSYISDWVGDRTGGSEASIDGNGAPVVGVYGSQDDEHASALGLIYASPPAAAPVPPADPQLAGPRRIPPQPARADARPPAVPAEAPRRIDPPEARVDQPKVEAGSAPVKVAASAVASGSGWPVWAAVGMPLAIFGAAAGAVFLVVLVPFGQKPQGGGPKSRLASPTVMASRSKRSEKNSPGPRKRPRPDEEEVIELGPEDLDPLPSPDKKLLLDVLPVAPPSGEETRAGITNAVRTNAKWPKLEL